VTLTSFNSDDFLSFLMVDVLNKKQRSYNMSMIKGRNTKPELFLRKLLFNKGLRNYRINYKMYGKPDIVFTKYKLVIFTDGCFWHKCPKCFKQPETHKAFWESKIDRNVERDIKVNNALKSKGWRVLRFWEHDIMKNPEKCLKKIVTSLKNQELKLGIGL